MPKKKNPEELAVLPSGTGEFVELPETEEVAELARRRSTTGRLYEKHILNKGVLIHPTTGSKIQIDDAFVRSLKSNFDNGTCDIVQVPLADSQNAHSEDPDRNIGEVVDIRERDGKVYAVIDARRADAAEKLGKTWLGASAMLSTNYKDTKTGERVGPTLLHVAVTNRPYVTGLEDYKEVIAASASGDSEVVAYQVEASPSVEVVNPEVESPVVSMSNALDSATESTEDSEEVQASADSLIDETLSASSPTEEITMTREELIAALSEHGIDVYALQAVADEAEANAALSNTLAEKLAETLELSSSSVDMDTVVGAIAEIAQEKVALSNRIQGLERAQAEHVVNGLVDAGFVLPAQKDVYVELRLSNPDTFEKLVPSEPIVKLGVMTGSEKSDEVTREETNIDAEITRLTAGFGK